MNLVLSYNNNVVLNTPVKDKREYFKLLNQLEREIDGVATCSLFDNSFILYQRKLNDIPLHVYNPSDGKKYSFTYFLENLYKFPMDLWMLYYNYNKMSILKNSYGF